MRNFHDTFETSNQSFISVFSICMTVPLKSSYGQEHFTEGQKTAFSGDQGWADPSIHHV